MTHEKQHKQRAREWLALNPWKLDALLGEVEREARADERREVCRVEGHRLPLDVIASGGTGNGDWSVLQCRRCGAVREFGYPFGVITKRVAALMAASGAGEHRPEEQ